MYFYSDKLSHYKTYDFRKFLIPDAYKHVRLQNTFNRCKVHQILPLTVDYACFLVKCINYQNVMCSKIIYFLQDLARFLQDSCKNCSFCKRNNSCKIFARNEKVLQDCCNNFARCVFFKNFAKVVLSARILHDFCKSCFSCELGRCWVYLLQSNCSKFAEEIDCNSKIAGKKRSTFQYWIVTISLW